jgi:hypothetical protein
MCREEARTYNKAVRVLREAGHQDGFPAEKQKVLVVWGIVRG